MLSNENSNKYDNVSSNKYEYDNNTGYEYDNYTVTDSVMTESRSVNEVNRPQPCGHLIGSMDSSA
ncbi:13772_t:CDS:2, partial [Racocetra persica]